MLRSRSKTTSLEEEPEALNGDAALIRLHDPDAADDTPAFGIADSFGTMLWADERECNHANSRDGDVAIGNVKYRLRRGVAVAMAGLSFGFMAYQISGFLDQSGMQLAGALSGIAGLASIIASGAYLAISVAQGKGFSEERAK